MYQLFDIFASLAKTDISRHELVESDHSDLDSIENRIRRKPNRHEDQPDRNSLMANSPLILRRWLAIRQDAIKINIPALLLIAEGEPLNRSGVYNPVTEAARRPSCMSSKMPSLSLLMFVPPLLIHPEHHFLAAIM